jgi:hypothetical protein
MIFYLVRQQHAYTLINYLESWGLKKAALFIRPLFYEQLWHMKRMPSGTYIFSDIERLNPEEAEITAKIANGIAKLPKTIRLLNHPTLSMRRYELLRTLYERGWNQFNVYRLTECRQPERFPVFLRGENDHKGSRTPLLQTPEELNLAIAQLSRKGKSRENQLITEFCDTSDKKGVFRKYSAFIVGDRIIPRHVFFDCKWMLKYPNLVAKEMILEELEYIKNNPHESYLRGIFQLAKIEYGRIDYGLSDGIPQVWEINTNPVSLFDILSDNKIQQLRLPITQYFSHQFEAALESIDCHISPSVRISLSIQSKNNSKKNSKCESIIRNTIDRAFLSCLLPLPYPTQLTIRKKIKILLKKFIQKKSN